MRFGGATTGGFDPGAVPPDVVVMVATSVETG